MKSMRYIKQLNGWIFFGLAIALLGFSSCTQISERSTATNTEVETEPLLYYWDEFDVTDTVVINNPEVGEQAFVDFIVQFPGKSDTIIKQAIFNLFAKTDKHPLSQQYFIRQFEHYLYDANSPMRNDVYYEQVLEVLLQSRWLDEADTYRFRERLILVRRNKVDTQALDFKFQRVDGSVSTLYDGRAPFTLLMFYEPGCSHCEAVIEQLQSTPGFQELTNKGTLDVLAVYALGERSIWEKYQPHIPASWMNGFDQDMQILSKALYDLKASPTMYLLDQNKKVILKDTDLARLFLFLNIK